MFSIIVAADEKNGIGKDNKLPWLIKGDMRYFKSITSQTFSIHDKNVVIMGRKTFESIPEKFRPLPDRINIVVSRNYEISKTLPAGVVHVTSLNSALNYVNDLPNIGETFVIGGAMLYNEAFKHPDLQMIYLTRIHKIYDCDTHINDLPNEFCLMSRQYNKEDDLEYSFETHKKIGCCL